MRNDKLCIHCGRSKFAMERAGSTHCGPPYKNQPHDWDWLDRANDAMHDVQAAIFNHRRRSLRQRLVDWFELKIGVGGDLHRQTYYAWRDYPDAMRLTIGVFFMLGAFVAILAMIAGAWLIG